MFAKNDRNYTFRGFILTVIQYSCNSVQMPYFHYQFQTVKLLHLFIPIFWISHQLSVKSALCSLCHPTAMSPLTLFCTILYVMPFFSLKICLQFWSGYSTTTFFSPISDLTQKRSIFTNLSYFKNQRQDTNTFSKSLIKFLWAYI